MSKITDRRASLKLAAEILEAGGHSQDARAVLDLIEPGPELVWMIEVGDTMVSEDYEGGYRVSVAEVIPSARMQIYIVALQREELGGPEFLFRGYAPGDVIENVSRNGKMIVINIPVGVIP